MKKIDKTIAHIRELERRLGEVDKNLRYIKVVQALKIILKFIVGFIILQVICRDKR